MEGLLYTLDDEHFALELDLPDRVGAKALEGHLTRYQRAPEGTEQSAAGRGYHVVECGGVGLLRVGRDAVVLRDLRVDPEIDRLVLTRNTRRSLPYTGSTSTRETYFTSPMPLSSPR